VNLDLEMMASSIVATSRIIWQRYFLSGKCINFGLEHLAHEDNSFKKTLMSFSTSGQPFNCVFL
jgi:hypothetical protein